MLRKFTLVFFVIGISNFKSYSQNTWDLVYINMQTSCTFSSCHSNGNAASGLDLEGSGATAQQDVYNNLYNTTPTNSYSAGIGHRRVYPGDPYKSTLFRKICGSLDDFVQLDANEGNMMPSVGGLTDVDKELVRQWILFGAPETGNVADTVLIADYYNGNGVDGIPTPIAAPDPSEGYQIKLGPFFLEPSGEIEYFLKHEVENDDTTEIHQVDVDLGLQYSHHFIIFRYRDPGEGGLPAGNPSNYNEGLRLNNAHNDVTFVTANQQSGTIDLPEGTAFRWLPNTVLDLNTHYINYDANKVLKCENYINIYTQEKNTAKQLMYTDLYVNSSIIIPSTGQNVQFTDEIYDAGNTDEMYFWMITTHTHKLGKDFDVFLRDDQGNVQDQVFDAEYMNGDPNGVFISYDYQHPPVRYWEYPFLPVQKNEGLVQIATYNNNTGQVVFWGDTSDDEMMITMAMYVEDTTGLGNFGTPASLDQQMQEGSSFKVYPNPSSGTLIIESNVGESPMQLQIIDITGSVIKNTLINNNIQPIEISNLSNGLYTIQIQTEEETFSQKLILNK